MNWFKQRSVVTASPRKLRSVEVYVEQRETYTENPDEPGCFKKRVFWEAQATERFPSYDKSNLRVTGEGATQSQALVACFEAVLNWSEGVCTAQ